MQLSEQLQKAIDQLYTVFKDYPIDATELRAFSCECCVSTEEIVQITTKPLRQLTEQELMPFAQSAISTFGDVRHYKHYLPRIFELMVEENSELAENFICFEKLNYGSWDSWPEEEQLAVSSYFRLLWASTINNHKISEYRLNTVFGILLAYGYFKNTLKLWEQSSTTMSTLYLVDGVLRYFSFEANDTVKNQFLDWLRSPAILQKFENEFMKTEDPILANEISIAYTILEKKGSIFIR